MLSDYLLRLAANEKELNSRTITVINSLHAKIKHYPASSAISSREFNELTPIIINSITKLTTLDNNRTTNKKADTDNIFAIAQSSRLAILFWHEHKAN